MMPLDNVTISNDKLWFGGVYKVADALEMVEAQSRSDIKDDKGYGGSYVWN